MMKSQNSRREFLEQLGVGASGLVLAGYTAKAQGFPKNETIHIGVIGCGGRATRQLMPGLRKIAGVKITAVCDVYDAHLAAAKAAAVTEAFATRDYHALLQRSDVDAVVIGSPDHWHVPMTVDACQAGKDVYVEKPLTHKLGQGQAVIDAQNRHRRIVQVGTQQRSMPQFIKARELVQAGALGALRKIHMAWNRNQTPFQKRTPDIQPEQLDWERFLGPAPRQPFDPYRFQHWRWFWDFGGGILTDLMVHWIDAVQFIQDIGLPAEITTIGDQLATQGVWETPDTIQTLMRFPKAGVQVHFEGTFVNAHGRPGITIMGEDATLFVDRRRLELIPEAGRKTEALDLMPGGGGDVPHLADWIAAIRTRRKPSAPAEAGVLAAHIAQLGNEAYRQGRVIRLEG